MIFRCITGGLRGIRALLIILGFLILGDMFILHGKIKYLILALGNTTDYSPFSTDGQSNYIVLFLILILVIVISILLRLFVFGKPNTEEEKEDG